MAHELLTSLPNRDEQLNIAGNVNIPDTSTQNPQILTLIWIHTIGGTETCAPQ
jgi:hypothetical protein